MAEFRWQPTSLVWIPKTGGCSRHMPSEALFINRFVAITSEAHGMEAPCWKAIRVSSLCLDESSLWEALQIE